MKFEEVYVGQRVKIQLIKLEGTTYTQRPQSGMVMHKHKRTHKVTIKLVEKPSLFAPYSQDYYSWRLIDNDPPLVRLARALDE